VAAGALALGVVLSLLLETVEPPAADQSASTQAPEAARAYTFRRVVCMSPAVTEIVFAVGAGDRVVGVSDHTMYPAEALNRPVCGGAYTPSSERILSVDPDLIITQGEAEKLRRFAADNGIGFVSLALTDLHSICSEAERLGGVLEVPERAALVVAEMRYRLALTRARTSAAGAVPVFLVTFREPGALNDLNTVGAGTFLDDVLAAAGGRNVFHDLPQAYGPVSKEAVLARRPEVIIELHGEGGDPAGAQAETERLWAGMAGLPAVQSGRVHVVESTYAMIPGPRVADLAERFAALLHGEEEAQR
jgi:iron complex transport system substrate-binding protein